MAQISNEETASSLFDEVKRLQGICAKVRALADEWEALGELPNYGDSYAMERHDIFRQCSIAVKEIVDEVKFGARKIEGCVVKI